VTVHVSLEVDPKKMARAQAYAESLVASEDVLDETKEASDPLSVGQLLGPWKKGAHYRCEDDGQGDTVLRRMRF
jgi:hypothetical protein